MVNGTANLNINLKRVQASTDDVCQIMKALSSRGRMMLSCQIGRGEKCVGELEGYS